MLLRLHAVEGEDTSEGVLLWLFCDLWLLGCITHLHATEHVLGSSLLLWHWLLLLWLLHEAKGGLLGRCRLEGLSRWLLEGLLLLGRLLERSGLLGSRLLESLLCWCLLHLAERIERLLLGRCHWLLGWHCWLLPKGKELVGLFRRRCLLTHPLEHIRYGLLRWWSLCRRLLHESECWRCGGRLRLGLRRRRLHERERRG